MNDDRFTSPHLEPSDRGNLAFGTSHEAMPRWELFLLKKLFYILWTVGEKTGSPSVSHERYQRWRGGAWAFECVGGRESEGEMGGGREGEVLEATGYLSLYNGVSYEKTSVNFLSDLQQSITQSSHSADLWSRCLTESCHCSQPPTRRNPNFGLTNFPCNAIQLFSPSAALQSLWRWGSWDMWGQRARPWQCARPAWGHVGRDRSLYLPSAHPGRSNPAPRGAGKHSLLWWWRT